MEYKDIDFSIVVGKKFSSIFKEQILDLKLNKGKSGTLLEEFYNIIPSSNIRDLEDYEIKTYKKNESIAITMLKSIIHQMTDKLNFEETNLYKKISKIIFVKTNKDSENPEEWFYENIYLFDINNNKNILEKIKKEYLFIQDGILQILNERQTLKTINGDGLMKKSNSYLQIRTKDSGKYHPIVINEIKISEKSYAFYFRNLFVREIVEASF